MNASDTKFVANEETVLVPQQKNKNDNHNLLTPDAHVHKHKDAKKTKDSAASYQSNKTNSWKKKNSSDLSQLCCLKGEAMEIS